MRLDRARLVAHLPLHMTQARNLLPAKTLSIQKQLNLIEIRVNPHWNLLTFPAIPGPVRKQVEHRLLGPPRLVVEEVVLGKSARIHDAEVRVDRRPSIWSRLAAIIESCPRKSTSFPLARRVERPPLLGKLAPLCVVHVVGAESIS